MFGKILGLIGDNIRLENLSKKAELSLINIHVVFLSGDLKYVGIIKNIDKDFIDISLVGEIKNNAFTHGWTKNPNLDASCRIITKQELETILGSQDFQNKNTLLIGNSEIYKDFKVTVNKDNFFCSHFAILGNTGSGKSCGMARILQNIFYLNPTQVPKNAHFVIFDAFSDYESAFSNMNQVNGLHFKKYNTEYNKNLDSDEAIKIPAYFLDVDDLAILLDVRTPDLISTGT